MAFRVYDTEECKWITDNVYMNSIGDLFKIKNSLFGMVRIPLELSQDRYVFHEDIRLNDNESNLVFVGDYLEATIGKVDEDDENSEYIKVIGLVIYAEDLASYIIICEENNTFYELGNYISDRIKIVGNVFDGIKNEE